MGARNRPEDTAAQAEPASIVGVGVVVVDLLALIDRYPAVDTKQDVRRSQVQVGGPVPTALAQLTTFGHRCRFASVWGDDPLGRVIEADLRDWGIDYDSGCLQPKSVTGHSQVWIDAAGARTSVTQRPDASCLQLSAADRDAIRSARFVHLDGWPSQLAVEVATYARSVGVGVALDTGSPKPLVDELLPLVDVVNAPRRFVESHLGTDDLVAGAEMLTEHGPTIATVTDGDRGAVLVADGQTLIADALEIPQAIDTNGAGDVFSGATLHGVLQRWSPEQTLRFAVAAAGLKCGGLGNRSALVDVQTCLDAAERVVIES